MEKLFHVLISLIVVLCLQMSSVAAQDVLTVDNSTQLPVADQAKDNSTFVSFINSTSTRHPTPDSDVTIFSNSTNDSALPTLSSTHTCGVKDGDAVRKLRVITSSTDEYFPVFMNWLVYYHKICPNIANIYFICLDTTIEKKLPKYGLSCAHVHHSSAVHDIWLVRTRLTHTLLKEGYDVLLTDSDALWVHNPFPYIEAHITSDVISSRGSFPDAISKRLGATLCMGFVYIKASENTVTLWGEIAARMGRTRNPDDQKEINSYLDSLHLRYKVKPTYIGSTDFNTGHFQHHSHDYAITLLPHTLFRRICDAEKIGDVQSSVVAHCLTHQKVGAHKKSTAEALGVWLLKDDWDTIALHSDMEAYLDSISIDNESANMKTVVRILHTIGSGLRMRGVRVSIEQRGQNISSVVDEVTRTRYIRGNPTTSQVISHELASSRSNNMHRYAKSKVCYEYHSNRQYFNVSDSSCWYVSSSAPDISVREYEELASI